jgi:hypothetical protein
MFESGFTALELPNEICNAVKIWKAKFNTGSNIHFRLEGGDAYGHKELAVWGSFRRKAFSGKDYRDYWNSFGLDRNRSQIIVEINPPESGRRGVNGIIAEDATTGKRWALHRGRLREGRLRSISEDEFDSTFPGKLKRISVRFSKGSSIKYYPVANIDEDATELQRKVADFVFACAEMRKRCASCDHKGYLYFTDGVLTAVQESY